jgi:23S rRNA (uracil1939-C5)-methyltransferase
MIAAGATLTLDIEKATAGGRMLARHHGQVVLVWGAIPGERVDARVERTGKGVAYAETIGVLSPSTDRRSAPGDWRCGGNVFAHVDYPRQLRLKGEILQDGFARIGRIPLPEPPDVIASPEAGYRMRARLHARDGRLGFYREGSHELCDAGATRQLLPATNQWIADAQEIVRRERLVDVIALEIAENISGDERACHIECRRGSLDRYAALSSGLVGLSVRRDDVVEAVTIAGTPAIHDEVQLREDEASSVLRMRRHARAFFQGNRFLVSRLVREVIASVHPGPVIDLYAGGGLFGLSIASTGAPLVTLVEGDVISGTDLEYNARPLSSQVRVERRSVEAFLAGGATRGAETVVVDPPRTGLSKEALAGIVRMKSPGIVYVSCDVPTLARDARGLLDAGYGLSRVTALDLFPNTAHVETVAVFSRAEIS